MNEEMSSEGKKKFSITEGIVNALLIFILGFLVGVSVKSEAKKRITIGYEDYLTSKFTSDFDLSAKASQNQNPNQVPQPEGGAGNAPGESPGQ